MQSGKLGSVAAWIGIEELSGQKKRPRAKNEIRWVVKRKAR